MIITAVVVWDGDLGGLDLLEPVGAEPVIARSVRGVLDGAPAECVQVLVPAGRVSAVDRACRGLPVRVHTRHAEVPVRTHVDQRAGAGPGDGWPPDPASDIVLLHDAARPLAPPELAGAVLDAVRTGHPAALPVLAVTDTVKRTDPTGLILDSPSRETLRVAQTPVALRAELLSGPPLRAVLRLIESRVPVHAVPGHPLAFPVRTDWDLQLARLLAEPGRSP